MSNVITLGNLRNQIPYLGDGLRQWTDALGRFLPPGTVASDALSYYIAPDLTTTAVAIKASAGKVHGVFLQSTGAIAYLSLWNVAQGSVTVGTTSQGLRARRLRDLGADQRARTSWARPMAPPPLWATAITAAISTTARGGGIG
jgi:hypothetical protein